MATKKKLAECIEQWTSFFEKVDEGGKKEYTFPVEAILENTTHNLGVVIEGGGIHHAREPSDIKVELLLRGQNGKGPLQRIIVDCDQQYYLKLGREKKTRKVLFLFDLDK